MSEQQNKAVITKLAEELWNKGNTAVLDEVFAVDFLDHHASPGLPPGLAGLKIFINSIRSAFSDSHTTVDDLIAKDDKVVWRWTFYGTHANEFMGIPATGKQVKLTGITIDRLEGGKIVERWREADFIGVMQQLGAIPSPTNA